MAHDHWIRYALNLATQGEAAGEVPVGAVLVCNEKVLGEGYNQPIQGADPTLHAEIVAIRQAGLAKQNYRLPGSTLYVTLEPCLMCVGAMVHARIERVVFGAFDLKTGACGSKVNALAYKYLNHQVDCIGGIMEKACSQKLKTYFQKKR